MNAQSYPRVLQECLFEAPPMGDMENFTSEQWIKQVGLPVRPCPQVLKCAFKRRRFTLRRRPRRLRKGCVCTGVLCCFLHLSGSGFGCCAWNTYRQGRLERARPLALLCMNFCSAKGGAHVTPLVFRGRLRSRSFQTGTYPPRSPGQKVMPQQKESTRFLHTHERRAWPLLTVCLHHSLLHVAAEAVS